MYSLFNVFLNSNSQIDARNFYQCTTVLLIVILLLFLIYLLDYIYKKDNLKNDDKYCRFCGSELKDNSFYCSECGKELLNISRIRKNNRRVMFVVFFVITIIFSIIVCSAILL